MIQARILHSIPAVPVLLTALLAGCSTNHPTSDIPGQLDDGGWVMNIPGQPHTHRVVLADCPNDPVIVRHTHDHQHGMALHKHNGCFVCQAD